MSRFRIVVGTALGFPLALGLASGATFGNFASTALGAVSADMTPCTAVAVPEVETAPGVFIPAATDVDRVKVGGFAAACAGRPIDIAVVESSLPLLADRNVLVVVRTVVPDPVPVELVVTTGFPVTATSSPASLVVEARVVGSP